LERERVREGPCVRARGRKVNLKAEEKSKPKAVRKKWKKKKYKEETFNGVWCERDRASLLLFLPPFLALS